MRIKEIINEEITDIVARFYKESSKDAERHFNPENVKYKEENNDYYDKHFKEWFAEEIVPVFTKPVDKPQHKYNVTPKADKLQSPGYRGLQYALAHAGLPYNKNVQDYKPDASRIVAQQTMDGLTGMRF
jgi:hypothetical protein